MYRIGLFALLALAQINAALAKNNLEILSIYSYHKTYHWTETQATAYEEGLVRLLPDYTITFLSESLNAKRSQPTQEFIHLFSQYLESKYSSVKPDLIYITDDYAANYILENPPEFIKTIPVVFSGIDSRDLLQKIIDHKTSHKHVTGVFETIDFWENVELLNLIYPASHQFLYLSDDADINKTVAQQVKSTSQPSDNADIIFISNNNLELLLNEAKKHPNIPIILGSLGQIKDNNGKLIHIKEVIDALQKLNQPLMHNGSIMSGVTGVLGGVEPIIPYGELAAQLSYQIIQGTPAEAISPIESPKKRVVLFWDQMKKFNIQPIPDVKNKVKILNQPDSFVRQNAYPLFWFSAIIATIGFIIILSTMSSIRRRDMIIHEQQRDALTNCPNRLSLINNLNQCDEKILAFIDINNFSSLNSFYGNHICDQILHDTATLIKNHLPGEAKLYRVSGDVFAILYPEKFSQSMVTESIKQLLERLENNIFFGSDLNISLTATAGISSSDSHKHKLNEASIALTEAKQSRKNWSIYQHNNRIEEQQDNNAIWSKKLKKAISESRIKAFYQPIINNQTGEIASYEALIRLIDEDNTVVTPFYFLEIAERNNQYAKLTQIMFEQCFALAKLKQVNISINITLDDIYHANTQKILFNNLIDLDIGEFITFEITETQNIKNKSVVNDFIQRIKSFGCHLSIDDFGTGYANFSHLIDLNADTLKIDGSIIQRLLMDEKAELVVRSIVDYAKRMGMKTTAEFVDSQELFEKVKAIGVDYSQGYYFGEPAEKIHVRQNIHC